MKKIIKKKVAKAAKKIEPIKVELSRSCDACGSDNLKSGEVLCDKCKPKKNTEATLTIDRKAFTDILNVAKDFLATKHTMPILSTVLFSAEEDSLTLTATDLEKAWRITIPAQCSTCISRAIPFHLLQSEVKALNSEITEVSLVFDDQTVMINGRCKIFTMSADDFPSWPEIDESQMLTITVEGLAAKISTVLPAAGESDTRYTLNSVCIDTGKGRICGTDGHRLHMENFSATEKGVQVLIPRATAVVMARHGISNELRVTEVEENKEGSLIAASGSRIFGSLSGGIIFSRLIEGNYPNIDNVIPENQPMKVVFQGPQLQKILEGAIPVASERANAIRLKINGSIEIEAEDASRGHYQWQISCERTGGQDDLTLGFNARYLMDMVRSYTTKENSTVVMSCSSALSPVLFNDLAVIMPMRT